MRPFWIRLSLLLLLAPGFRAAWAEPAYAKQSPARAAAKFRRTEKFAKVRPKMARAMAAQLEEPKLDEKTAVAAIFTIMNETNMRIGSEKYAQREAKVVKVKGGGTFKKEPSYGGSSLQKDQVTVDGNDVTFRFKGKSHVKWVRKIKDNPELATTVKMFKAQRSGPRLFSIRTEDGVKPVTEVAVREAFREFDAKPKDLRTVQANEKLDEELAKLPKPKTKAEAKANLKVAIEITAAAMNHTPEICEKSYLDPRRIKAYQSGLR